MSLAPILKKTMLSINNSEVLSLQGSSKSINWRVSNSTNSFPSQPFNFNKKEPAQQFTANWFRRCADMYQY